MNYRWHIIAIVEPNKTPNPCRCNYGRNRSGKHDLERSERERTIPVVVAKIYEDLFKQKKGGSQTHYRPSFALLRSFISCCFANSLERNHNTPLL
jgi:hypothetical protein